MIVIEGLDATGKSTLADCLAKHLHWPIQPSEGPPRYEGEMTLRVERYLKMSRHVIYDRHPCVSQPIYGTMRTHNDDIDSTLVNAFYAQDPLFIYCDPANPSWEASRHTYNPEVDTEAHLAKDGPGPALGTFADLLSKGRRGR